MSQVVYYFTEAIANGGFKGELGGPRPQSPHFWYITYIHTYIHYLFDKQV